MDKVDNKIIELLREFGEMNLSKLMLKTFAKESNFVFKNRLKTLIDKNIITMELTNRHGKEYKIKLTERFK